MKVYLANKMVGRPEFNFPWFFMAEEKLRELTCVTDVFNPARHDMEFGFNAFGTDGTDEAMELAGFSRRAALTADWNWIGEYSDCLVIGPDWKESTGTISEVACHQALHLPVFEFDTFISLHKTNPSFPENYNGFEFQLAPILSLSVE